MHFSRILLAMSFFAFFGLAQSSALEIGQAAPALTCNDETGQPLNLGELYRQGIVLVYFYPKADTPGCTAEACSLRDSFEGLKARGLTIVGVSSDKADSQKKFQDKYKLPFKLLADSDGAVAKAFGVPSLLGFTKRQSFLVKDGKIVWRDLSVSPKTHVSEVNKALDALK